MGEGWEQHFGSLFKASEGRSSDITARTRTILSSFEKIDQSITSDELLKTLKKLKAARQLD